MSKNAAGATFREVGLLAGQLDAGFHSNMERPGIVFDAVFLDHEDADRKTNSLDMAIINLLSKQVHETKKKKLSQTETTTFVSTGLDRQTDRNLHRKGKICILTDILVSPKFSTPEYHQ